MDLKIPMKQVDSQPPSAVDTDESDRYTPGALTSHCNPLMITGYPVLSAADLTATVSNAIERVIRESMGCTRDPFMVHCAFQVGRLVGITKNRNIVLPVETESVLDDDASRVKFIPEVSPKCVDVLYMDVFTSQTGSHRLVPDSDIVEIEVVSSSNMHTRNSGDNFEGFHHTRIYRVPYSTEEGLCMSALQCWDHNVLNSLIVYRPQSHYHYRLQTSSMISDTVDSNLQGSATVLKLAFRHLRKYKTNTVEGKKLVKWGLNVSDHWDIVVNDEMVKLPIEKLFECFTACLISGKTDVSAFQFFDHEVVEDSKRQYVEAWVDSSQLAKQFLRLTQAKANRFGYIISMLHSNLRMIMDSFDSTSLEAEVLTDFYPNRFGGTTDAVQFHYDTRKLVRQKGSAIEALRRNNNLVKRILIACHIRCKSTVLDLACGHGQDLDKYATVGISHVLGIDISLAEIMEARRRFCDQNRSGRLRFKAEFHHGNVMEEKVFTTYVRNKKFDVVFIQLAIHYMLSDEASATMLLRNIHKALCDKGIFIGSTVCCNAVAKGLIANAPYQSSEDGGGIRWEFGNSIFRVTMEESSIEDLTDGDINKEISQETITSRLESRWGLKYHFFLMESIDAAEYVVPWKAFSDLCTNLGFRLIETFTFPEYLERAHSIFKTMGAFLEPKVMDNVIHHLKMISSVTMSSEQQEAFMLYRIFVFEKVTGRDKMYMQGVKIRRTV